MPWCLRGGAIEHHADDIDLVARVRIDGDCRITARWRNRSPAMTFDADRTGDGQRPVVGRIEHVYLAVGGRRGIGGREVPAGRRDVGAVIAVAAAAETKVRAAPACAGTAGRQDESVMTSRVSGKAIFVIVKPLSWEKSAQEFAQRRCQHRWHCRKPGAGIAICM